MKRWTLRILLCLILGAITTVAVAWGCARFSPVHAAVESHVRFVRVGWGVRKTTWAFGDGVDRRYYEYEAGFPIAAMRSKGFWSATNLPRILPHQPVWRGFLIDTLFYAAIWGGVWFGFVGGKRVIRTKRGRCPRCGYDLRGHRHEGTEARRHEEVQPGCPECGWNREESAA